MIELDLKVPEGYEVVGYRCPDVGEPCLNSKSQVWRPTIRVYNSMIVLREIDDIPPWDRIKETNEIVDSLRCRMLQLQERIEDAHHKIAKMDGWCDDYDTSLSNLSSMVAKIDKALYGFYGRLDGVDEKIRLLANDPPKSPIHGDAAGRD